MNLFRDLISYEYTCKQYLKIFVLNDDGIGSLMNFVLDSRQLFITLTKKNIHHFKSVFGADRKRILSFSKSTEFGWWKVEQNVLFKT